MFRKSVALIMIVVCTLVCLPVSSMAAESDLQEDFDNGLMTLSTSLTYYKQGVGHTALSSFDVTENNAFEFSNIDYTFSKYNNPTLTFGHRFDLSYNDGSVLIPEGNSLTFTVRNFYSSVFPNDNFEDSAWLDMTKYKSFSMYFYDFNGTAYLVDKDMYELSIAQDNSLITVKMHSDMYDFDIYKLRLIIAFDFNAFYNYTNDFYYTEDSFLSNGSIKFEFGYAFLSFDIDSDEQVTTGLLTSIIEYVKSIWDSIKNLPANIKTSLTSLFDKISSGISNLGTSISGFFDSLKTKLTNLFKGVTDGISNLFGVMTEEQTTYAPIDEGELPSDYQNAEDEAFDSAGVGDLGSNIDSAFNNADSVFSNNNAYAFISGSMGDILFYDVKISGLIVFSLAMGLCVLILGRKVNA